MGTKFAVALAFSIITVGCGGSPPSESAAATSVPVEEATTEQPPAELALVAPNVTIAGDSGALVVPGETITVEHLVYNSGPGATSMGFRVRLADPAQPEPELSAASVRIPSGDWLVLTSTMTVPTSAEVDDVFEYEVVAVDVDDISQQSVVAVQLLVVDADGVRPEVGPNSGVTPTNQKVVVYVIGDDSDDDGDLEYGSLRVIAGGYLAAEITGAGDGTITYVPFANVTGTDMLLYELCDSEQRCDTATVTIEVNA